ncbi:AGAP010962-PA [Anopheles gambiae str. PEST]|uniref:AGAP010962-PA n=1 Tax=Anopheles gambiae TaxID=7165 RepID=A0NBZ4_ANOGA|nr:AGAP010962-PA [Anopheles gambiae str. PEST]
MPFRSDRRWLSVVSARSARIKSSSPFSTSLCSLQSSPAPPRPLCHTGFKVQLIVCSLRFPIYSPTSEGCGEGPVVNNCLFSAAFCCCDRCFLVYTTDREPLKSKRFEFRQTKHVVPWKAAKQPPSNRRYRKYIENIFLNV